MKKRKLLSILLGSLLTLNLMCGASFADETLILGKYTIQEAADLSGFSVEDLTAYKEIAGDNFDSEVERFIESSISTVDVNNKTTRALPGGLSSFRSRIKMGDIHVTADNKTSGYRHGHAALAISSTQNLETLGGSTLSVIRNNQGWENHNTYALVRIKSSSLSSSKIASAVKYGQNNLTGIKYSANSGWGSLSTVNCASLVMRAYKYGANFTFTNSYPTAISLPREFIDSKHTTKIYSYNMPW